MFVASNGVTLTGQMTRGDGDAVVYGNLLSGTGNFVDGAPNIDTYADWESLTAADYYLAGGAGGGGGGGAGQAIATATNTTPTVGGVKPPSPGAGMYTNTGALTLTSSPIPIPENAVQSAAQAASSSPAIGIAIPGMDFVHMAQLLSALNPLLASWPAMPASLASFGGPNILPLAQLLENSMAGWMGPSRAQLEQFAQNWGEFEHQVFADLTTDPFALTLDTGQLSTR